MAPDPIVVADHARGIEMRPIAQRVSISDDNDRVIVRHRRPDGRVDAEIGRPSSDEHSIRGDLFQRGLQASSGERIIEGLVNDDVGVSAVQLRQE